MQIPITGRIGGREGDNPASGGSVLSKICLGTLVIYLVLVVASVMVLGGIEPNNCGDFCVPLWMVISLPGLSVFYPIIWLLGVLTGVSLAQIVTLVWSGPEAQWLAFFGIVALACFGYVIAIAIVYLLARRLRRTRNG